VVTKLNQMMNGWPITSVWGRSAKPIGLWINTPWRLRQGCAPNKTIEASVGNLSIAVFMIGWSDRLTQRRAAFRGRNRDAFLREPDA